MAVAVDVSAGPEAPVARAVVAVYAVRGGQVLEIPLLEIVQVSVGADVATVSLCCGRRGQGG